MIRRPALIALPSILLVALGAVACSSEDDGGSASGIPTVVVTTSILGDVVANVVGDAAEVEVLMPPGVDPHEFELSAAQAASLQEADAVVANGLGFEAGMADAIDAAEDAGVPVYEVAPDLDPLPLAEGAHDHADDEHAEDGTGDEHTEDGTGDEHAADEDDHAGEEATGDEHAGEEEHADEGELDPHVFTDPARMADGAENIAVALGDAVPALDNAEVTEQAAAYAEQLRAADAAVEEQLSAIPEDRRVLVTNHEVFAYFADRYGFEVVGTVIPGGTTLSEPSSQELTELADTIAELGVPAIFADATSATDLADALAEEAGLDVEVVDLYSESLGEPGSGAETYLAMVEANATAIADALS